MPIKKAQSRSHSIVYVVISIILGNMMMGAAYSIFVLPHNIVSGGSGGIGIVISHLFNIDSVTFITIFMWLVFILGFFFFGKSFALKTLPSTFLYPAFIHIFNSIQPLQEMALGMDNVLLAAIFAGALYGIGGALIFKVGGSSGGTDIPALIIAKYTKISFEKILFLQDFFIIIIGIFAVGFESALIGIVLSFISMEAIDRLMFGGSETMMLFIISSKMDEINNHILVDLNRGTTIVPVLGGYTQDKRNMIQTVIARNEYIDLENYINRCDPDAFITVLNAKETYGEGFKVVKKKRKQKIKEKKSDEDGQ